MVIDPTPSRVLHNTVYCKEKQIAMIAFSLISFDYYYRDISITRLYNFAALLFFLFRHEVTVG